MTVSTPSTVELTFERADVEIGGELRGSGFLHAPEQGCAVVGCVEANRPSYPLGRRRVASRQASERQHNEDLRRAGFGQGSEHAGAKVRRTPRRSTNTSLSGRPSRPGLAIAQFPRRETGGRLDLPAERMRRRKSLPAS